MIRLSVVFLTCWALGSATVLAQTLGPCDRYMQDTVALAGRLTWRVYAGRPNYESVASGDQPDTVIVLRLDRPLCTQASETWDAHVDVSEVQLVLPADDFRAALHLRDAHFVLHGFLRGADWGWHHLAVLFHTRLPIMPRRAEGG
jgi:hypothetical protein